MLPTASASRVGYGPSLRDAFAEEPERPANLPLRSEASQEADLYLPVVTRPPVSCFLHGGFWRMPYGREQSDAVARDLASRGFAVWNLEYRRLGAPGSGWPGHFERRGGRNRLFGRTSSNEEHRARPRSAWWSRATRLAVSWPCGRQLARAASTPSCAEAARPAGGGRRSGADRRSGGHLRRRRR